MSNPNRRKDRGSEPKSLRESIALIGVAICLFAGLKACDHTGTDAGNSYRVRAVVDEVGDDSFHITDVEILETHGSAAERLEDGEVIHDNYKALGCLGEETSNDFDELKEAGELKEGSVVEVEASVGESYYDCKPGSKSGRIGPRSLLEHLEVLPS
jgi:hypothetical protein